MSVEKNSAFIVSGDVITETKTGHTGNIKKTEDGYEVKLNPCPLGESEFSTLQRRMKNWYFFTMQRNKK
jgi:hypothetical protein